MIPNAFGVPVILSLAFWAGVWCIVMVLVAPRIRQPFWIVCLIVSVAASIVQAFILPAMRGPGINWDVLAILRTLIINGVWAVGVAIIAPLVSNALGQRSHA